MIGIISSAHESGTVREFFELFKTPWEFYSPKRTYDIVIATSREIPDKINTRAVVIFNSQQSSWDESLGVVANPDALGSRVTWDGMELPLYGPACFLKGPGREFIAGNEPGKSAGIQIDNAYQCFRIGYDLFQEIFLLLSEGQPTENAQLPTLEIHIALIRAILLKASIPFIEVPPVPPDYDFMACLTHDVDFIGIKEHFFDHTFWGFVYRASVGSLINFLARRIRWSTCAANWKAVFSVPFVFLGLKDDFWLEFERYTEIEKGCGSTFYFIPFKEDPGASPAPTRRAAKYELSKCGSVLRDLLNAGCEIGLHGIDAWRDSEKGRSERAKVAEVAGLECAGTRMHWLYFSEDSPRVLEDIGLRYDSTVGYNDAVGFKAGTPQVYRPLSVATLLELPLTIQDTALFYPGRMHLTESEAMDSCKRLIQRASECGGVLVLNWHTRSLSPERLWGTFYSELLRLMRERRVWFATATQITEWFRKRRELSFKEVAPGSRHFQIVYPDGSTDCEASFLLRTYRPNAASTERITAARSESYLDQPLKRDVEIEAAV